MRGLDAIPFLPACALGAAAALLLAGAASALPGLGVAARRAVLLCGVVVALLVPALLVVGVPLGIGLLSSTPGPAPAPDMASVAVTGPVPAAPRDPGIPPAPGVASTTGAARAVRVAAPVPWGTAAIAVWALGAAYGLLRLGLALRASSRLRARLAPASDPAVAEAASSVARRLGLRSLAVLDGDALPSPVTLGLLRPVVALPAGFSRGLPDGDLERVLLHEGAHVLRRDPLAAVLGRIVRALHWFDPLAHVAVRRLHAASEGLADATAVARGDGSPRGYAACLLRLAEAGLARPARILVTCLGAPRGSLERRVASLFAPRALDGARLSWRGRALAATTALAVATALLVGRTAPAAAEEPASAPGARRPSAGPTLVYRGRVVDAGGKPVAGATVHVIHGPPPQVMVTHALLPWTTLLGSQPIEPVGGSDIDQAPEATGADGRFEVAGVEPPAGGTVVVVHPRYLPTRHDVPAERVRDGAVDAGDVVVGRGATLRATVRHPDGSPARDAWVVVQPEGMPYDRFSPGEIRSTRTAPDGTAVIEGLRATSYVAAALIPDSTLPVEHALDFGRASEVDHAFTLAPGACLRVSVRQRGVEGESARGARVYLERTPDEAGRVEIGAPPLATRVVEAGPVEFCGLEPGGEYVVTAVPADWAKDSVHHPGAFSVRAIAKAGEGPVSLAFAPVVPLVLEAATADGRVPPRLLVQARADWERYDRESGSPIDLRGWVDAREGRFTVDGFRKGPWFLTLWAPDHLPVPEGKATVVPTDDAPVRATLEPARSSAFGRVVARATGAPIAGAELASYEWIERLGDGQRAKATTDAAGRFRLSPLLGPGFPLRLEIGARGYLPVVRALPPDARREDLGDVALVRAATVKGTVVSDAGARLGGVEVTLVGEGSSARGKDGVRWTTTTDAAGAFTIGDVAPGRHALHVPGRPPTPVDVPEGAVVELPAPSTR